MNKCSWAGVHITMHQISYEAPVIFVIFQAYFAEKNFDELQAAAMEKVDGLTEEEWKKFIAYVGGFYGNASNYHSFGDLKFVPDLSADKFFAILRSNPKADQDGSLLNWALTLLPHVETEIFAYDAPFNQLGFPSEGGITAYFSRNMTAEDLTKTKDFLGSPEAVAKTLDILNTRVFKTGENQFLITVGSIDEQ